MGKQFNSKRRRIIRLSVLLLLISAVGCQQRTASKLLGTWIGQPDTATARAERESKKYGDRPLEDNPASNPQQSETDWQRFDVVVKFNFVSRDSLEMSLGDGSEPRSATWSVLETSLTGCTIEVETSTGADDSAERRRFQLEMDEHNGTCTGFLLSEVGADRQLGALYFRRPENNQ